MRRRNQNKGFSLFIILVLVVATVVPQWVCDVAELQVVHADPQTHHTAHPLIWDEASKSVVTDNSNTVSFLRHRQWQDRQGQVGERRS